MQALRHLPRATFCMKRFGCRLSCAANSAKDAEVCKEREALESAKQSLDRRVVELEQELDVQRRQITAGD